MLVVSCFLCWALGAGPAIGQTDEPVAGGPEVFVREDLDARDALRHLLELESQSQWGEAAEGYDRLVGQAGEGLVQVDPLHYRNVRDYVRERLMGWPVAAQQRYREIFETRAAQALEQLGAQASGETLAALAERYWLTAAGKRAAKEAAIRLKVEGRPEAARRWMERVGEGGNESGAAAGVVKDWAMSGGNASRAGVGGAVAEPGEVFWNAAELVEGHVQFCGSEPVVAGERVYVQAKGRLWAIGLNSGVVEWTFRPAEEAGWPERDDDGDAVGRADCGRGGLSAAVAGDHVFTTFERCESAGAGSPTSVESSVLACVEAGSGRVVWQVEASPKNLSGAFQPVQFFDNSPLVYEGRVYVVLRRPRELDAEDCRLVCFDQATGQQLWDAWIASGSAGAGRDRFITRSDPAGWGGDVFVQTNVGAVACVDGLTGRVRWVTVDPGEAVSATSRPAGWGRLRALERLWRAEAAPPQPVVVAGVKGAADAGVWTVPARSRALVAYDAENGREMRRAGRSELGEFKYLVGPVGGIVYAVGEHVIAYDTAGGKKKWELALGALGGGGCVGWPVLTEDRLWVPTRTGLGWVTLDGRQHGQVMWSRLHGDGEGECAGGTLAVVDGLMLVGEKTRVCCLASAGGGLKRLVERTERNPDDCGAWLDLARYALRWGGQEGEGGQNDRSTTPPKPPLAKGGKEDEADVRGLGLKAIDRALQYAEGNSVSTQPAGQTEAGWVKEQALEILIEAAERLSKAVSWRDEGLVGELLARARKMAQSDEQQVRYRFAFAAALERLGKVEEAVGLYQEVLDDPALRGVRCGKGFPLREGARRDSRTSTLAGRAAERALDELIRTRGRGVYARFDEMAAELSRKAAKDGDAARLREVLDRYPNCGTLGEMLAAWVCLGRQAARPLAAARFAEDVIRRRVEMRAGCRAAVLAQIVHAYLEAGDAVDGLAWLARGEREHPGEQWQEDGKAETFASLRRRLMEGGAGVREGEAVEVHGDWPVVTPPVRKAYTIERPHAVMLHRQEEAAWREDGDNRESVLLFEEGRIEALDPVTGSRLWGASPVLVGTPVWLGTRGELLVFSTRYQLFALNRVDGTICWTVGKPPKQAMSPAVDPEVLTHMAAVGLGQTVAVAMWSDGRAAGVELSSGEVLWERVLPHRAAPLCAVNDEHVAYVASQEPPVLVVLDVATGQDVCEWPLEKAGQVTWCGFTPARTVLAEAGGWLACSDPHRKSIAWQLDGLKAGRAGAILIGARGLYLPHEGGVECRSYADGRVLWEHESEGVVEGAVLRAWLDASRVYCLAERGVAVLDAATGEVKGSAAWGEEWTIGSAWLTRGHVLVSGLRRIDGDDGGAYWELKACWVGRDTGRGGRAEYQSLGQYPAAPDVGVCGGGVVVRAGGRVTGWTSAATSSQSSGTESGKKSLELQVGECGVGK